MALHGEGAAGGGALGAGAGATHYANYGAQNYETQRATTRSGGSGGGKDPETKSKYRGVCWHKQNNKWRAQVTVAGKTHHLGTFSDEADAARAFDTAVIKYRGEGAETNFEVRACEWARAWARAGARAGGERERE